YLVDAYSAVEEQRLKWTRNNQDTLRVDLYHNVCDSVTRGDTNAAGLGQRIVLPGTFAGGSRYMMQNYYDAMALREGSIPRDVFDVGEGSIPRDVQDVNIESTEGQEQIDVSDIELYRNDPDFAPTPKGIPCTLRRAGSTSVGQGSNDTREGDVEDGEKDVALMGGYDKVRGTPDDYRKFKRAVNLFTRDRDAQMIVDKIINRQHHVPEFSFEHHVLHDELVSMF
ncbi:FAR1-related sequence 5-like protein, partial [Tanacetum coccineum]